MAAENIKSWFWTGDTIIKSVAVGYLTGESPREIITGGAFYDGTRLNSQLIVWGIT